MNHPGVRLQLIYWLSVFPRHIVNVYVRVLPASDYARVHTRGEQRAELCSDKVLFAAQRQGVQRCQFPNCPIPAATDCEDLGCVVVAGRENQLVLLTLMVPDLVLEGPRDSLYVATCAAPYTPICEELQGRYVARLVCDKQAPAVWVDAARCDSLSCRVCACTSSCAHIDYMDNAFGLFWVKCSSLYIRINNNNK